MSKLFLSHSKYDQAFSKKLGADLIRGGHQVWFDEWEVEFGNYFRKKIDVGLNSSDYLLLVVSEKALTSKSVQYEVNNFLKNKEKSIIPILYNDVNLSKDIMKRRYVDFRNQNNYYLNFAELIGQLGKPNNARMIELELYDKLLNDYNKLKTRLNYLERENSRHGRLLKQCMSESLLNYINEENEEFPDYGYLNNNYAFEFDETTPISAKTISTSSYSRIIKKNKIALLHIMNSHKLQISIFYEAYEDYLKFEKKKKKYNTGFDENDLFEFHQLKNAKSFQDFLLFNGESIPEWCRNIFKQEEYIYFINTLSQCLESYRMSARVSEDGFLFYSDKEWNNLKNLAKRISVIEQDEWLDFISNELNNYFDFQIKGKFKDHSKLFQIKNDILLRIYLEDYFPDGNQVVYDLFANLKFGFVVDYPHYYVPLLKQDIKEWNIPLNVLFDHAFQNTIENQKKIPIEKVEIPLNCGYNVKAFVGNNASFWSAKIDSLDEAIGRYGTLFGVPSKDLMIYYQVNGVDTIDALSDIILLIHNMFNKEPAQLSEKLYWYYEGQYIILSWIRVDSRLVFIPPSEFSDILVKLVEK